MTRGVLAALLVLLLTPRVARADAVDDAFARGNEAAAAGEWADAATAYEEATRLLPEPNSTLAYSLGTAYANTGDLGRASYHLRLAADFRGGPSTEVAELARANLAEVRRRAELRATAAGAQIDRPATWWDLLLDALRAPWVGWAALLFGFCFLVGFALERRRRTLTGSAAGALQAVVVAFGLAYIGPGLLHGLALRADSIAPQAIVLGDRVIVRTRPGAHAESAFEIQGGARVRIVDRSPGWLQLRLPGGLTGWVTETDVGQLAQPPAGRRSHAPSRSNAPEP